MKKYCLIASLFCFFATLLPAQQTPIRVMQKAREKCLAITNGRYTVERKNKSFSKEDIFIKKALVVFDKNPADARFSVNFWLESKTDSFSWLYNGSSLVTIYHKKQKVIIDTMEKSLNSYVFGNAYSTLLRFPYTDSIPMGRLENMSYTPVFDPKYKNNKDTTVILIEIFEEEGSPSPIRKEVKRWYFDTKSGYPIAKEVELTDRDSNVQYEHFLITSYSFNSKENLQLINEQELPDTYDLVYSQPRVLPKLLPNDVNAPDWVAETLGGDSIQLSKLGAKLYLVDFWYRSCHPCVKAIPSLQSLHEKFNDKGLRVIGLNPMDYKLKDSEPFKKFIAHRNITYTLAFVDRNMPYTLYNVSGYPTFYLISSDRKIIYSHDGFGEALDPEVEKLITEYLETH